MFAGAGSSLVHSVQCSKATLKTTSVTPTSSNLYIVVYVKKKFKNALFEKDQEYIDKLKAWHAEI